METLYQRVRPDADINDFEIKDDYPAYEKAVSLQLSRALNEISGKFHTLAVNRRRNISLFSERLSNACRRVAGRNIRVYNIGSHAEGAFTPGMNTDRDKMVCLTDVNVIHNMTEWRGGKTNLLMLRDNSAPGYCRLQLLRSDMPLASEDLPNEHCAYDNRGRVILRHTWVFSYWRDSHAHLDIDHTNTYMFEDYFIALRCRSWNEPAHEFITRERQYSWPTQTCLQQVIQSGVYLIPVGHKLSPMSEFEWRIASPLAEKYLILSLNNVQLKCYILMKMLLKTFVVPNVLDCISSYHCKTAFLYCVENTKPVFWRNDNILQCVTLCLSRLHRFLTDAICPMFLIPGVNLFDGRFSESDSLKMKLILTNIFKSKGQVFLQIPIDNLGRRLMVKLTSSPLAGRMSDPYAFFNKDVKDKYTRKRRMLLLQTNILVDNINVDTRSTIINVYQSIDKLNRLIRYKNKQSRHYIQAFANFLCCWLGSLLAGVSLAYERRTNRMAKRLLFNGARSNVASMLKLASVLYCNKEFRKGDKLLQRLVIHSCNNNYRTVCACYDKLPATHAFTYNQHSSTRSGSRKPVFVCCVIFSPHEMHCIPTALRYELYRGVGNDIQLRDAIKDKWMDLAIVDCLPFLYYLQYVIYKQMGKHDLLQQTLHDLERCIREGGDLCHLETAWNLLGKCKEQEQDFQTALKCYGTSLKIRPRNNAANWHLATLCFRRLRNSGLIYPMSNAAN